MKRKVIAAGAAAVLIAGGGAWQGIGSATATTAGAAIHGWPGGTGSATATIASVKADAARTGSTVLLLYAHTVRHASIDVGGDGFGPGDYFMFEEQLSYTPGGAVIGRDSVRCTAGPRSFICDATMQILGKGKITVYGAFFSQNDTQIAVTGGTGRYQAVGGQLAPVGLSRNHELLVFEIKR